MTRANLSLCGQAGIRANHDSHYVVSAKPLSLKRETMLTSRSIYRMPGGDRHRPEYAPISYADASFWDLVSEHAVKRAPAVFEVARQRARMILTARAAGELAPEVPKLARIGEKHPFLVTLPPGGHTLLINIG